MGRLESWKISIFRKSWIYKSKGFRCKQLGIRKQTNYLTTAGLIKVRANLGVTRISNCFYNSKIRNFNNEPWS